MARRSSMIFPMRGLLRRAVLLAAGLALASCSSSGGAIGSGGRSGSVGGSTVQCAGGAGGGSGEPALDQVDTSAAIPASGFRHAMAVARCGYLNRCSNLAPYVVNQCVEALTGNVPWTYQACSGTAASASCATVNTRYVQPSDALLRAAADGTVAYDQVAAARCLDALLNQACLSSYLTENVPACAGVFTCRDGASAAGGTGGAGGGSETGGAAGAAGTGAAGGQGGMAGGGAGGAPSCAALLDPTPPLDACVTDAGCTAEAPHCVGGVCAASSCGLFDAGCTAFTQVGDNCSFNAPGLASVSSSTLPGTCAPGLACQGAVSGLHGGTCVVPQDVGAACTADAGCDRGLVCLCGLCQLPPVTGPCASTGQCRIGVAYCDFQTMTCQPVRPVDSGCNDAFNACAPGLLCQSGTCVIPTL